jgi:menaquinone-dependent protoporphyrinogen oxidase
MQKAVIIYSTTDGQTKRICEFLIQKLKTKMHIDLFSIDEIDQIELKFYDKIIVGASIRYGKHSSELFKFVEENIDVLKTKFTAFFTVNVVARKEGKNTPDTNPYMKKFLQLSIWKPNLLGVFAGKIDYPSYKFTDKHIIRLIMYITKGPTDTSGTFEFTNWKSVEDFSDQLLQK